MGDTSAQFVGSIPERYDRHLGPVLFEPYARDLAARLDLAEGARVLELACGTGILTRELRERLPATVRVIATDLNDDMIDYARERLHPEGNVEWRQADATVLPFADSSFDAVVCQFGVMFFPDMNAAVREIRRVLVPRGVLLFNVWDTLEHNDLDRISNDTMARMFPDDPPTFYRTPHGFNDSPTIHSVLERNGFAEVDVKHVALVGTSESARHAALGLVEGSPVSHEVRARSNGDSGPIVDAVAGAIARECGDHPVRARMRALVVRALRPA
jgi:ubiquinone/menaquinone biosynthesis C-methylase UbiE